MLGTLARLIGKKTEKRPFCCAVVAAAGGASRMGGVDKILVPLGEKPLLAHTLDRLSDCPLIDEIVVVARPDRLEEISEVCRTYPKVRRVVAGGDSRVRSVLNGVAQASPHAELIAVHDGARPFPSSRLLEEVITRAADCGAAAPAIPMKDTVKRQAGGLVAETPDRTTLCRVQTPQVFQAALLRGALEQAIRDGQEPTDDCAAVERLGMKPALTRGSEYNFKVTTPLDLVLARAVLEEGGYLADRTGL